jgi:hypothetical protein
MRSCWATAGNPLHGFGHIVPLAVSPWLFNDQLKLLGQPGIAPLSQMIRGPESGPRIISLWRGQDLNL